MKAMILAAGEGRRMQPLTLAAPKPLLPVGDCSLLEHHIRRLKAAGFCELVINTAYLGEQIRDFCGDGSKWGVSIALTEEPEPLETAGGIVNALPLLGESPFLVVNGDIWCPYPFANLFERIRVGQLMGPQARLEGGAHLVLVDNPQHNAGGDFSLSGNMVVPKSAQTLTFSGIGIYSSGFFSGIVPGKLPLKPLLDLAIAENRLTGEYWAGDWADIGTPERLCELNRRLAGETVA